MISPPDTDNCGFGTALCSRRKTRPDCCSSRKDRRWQRCGVAGWPPSYAGRISAVRRAAYPHLGCGKSPGPAEHPLHVAGTPSAPLGFSAQDAAGALWLVPSHGAVPNSRTRPSPDDPVQARSCCIRRPATSGHGPSRPKLPYTQASTGLWQMRGRMSDPPSPPAEYGRPR